MSSGSQKSSFEIAIRSTVSNCDDFQLRLWINIQLPILLKCVSDVSCIRLYKKIYNFMYFNNSQPQDLIKLVILSKIKTYE